MPLPLDLRLVAFDSATFDRYQSLLASKER
jgi:hypothetical protein